MDDTASYSGNRWQIEVVSGDQKGQTFALLEGAALVAGRSRKCDIICSSPSVSRRHCLFRVLPNGPEIEDLGAMKPAGVNGSPLSRNSIAGLRHGDRIQIGEKAGIELKVVDLEAGLLPAAADGLEETRFHTAADSATRFAEDGTGAGASAGSQTGFIDADKTVFMDPHGPYSFAGRNQAEDPAHDPATSYLPVEEAKKILDGSGRQSKRLLMLAALATAAVFLLSSINPGGKTKQPDAKHKLYKGSFFTCELPLSWTVGSKGPVVTMRPIVNLLGTEGIALLHYSNEKCRWWTYERHFPEMIGLVTGEISALRKVVRWVPLMQSEQTQLQLYRLYDTALPYAVFEGFNADSNRVALARFYLGGDSAFLSVIWPVDESAKQAQTIWNGLDIQEASADIDRRIIIPAGQSGKEAFTSVTNRLAEAQKWYAKADIAPGNVWRAYKALHAVHNWFSLNPPATPEQIAAADRAWSVSTNVVQRLDSVFAELQREVTTALLAGDRNKLNHFASMIQQEFPDNTDYRWLWAENHKNAVKK